MSLVRISLLKEDASQAKKETRELFTKVSSQRKENFSRDLRRNVKRFLKVSLLNIFGQLAYCLLDVVAIQKGAVNGFDRKNRSYGLADENDNHGGRYDHD